MENRKQNKVQMNAINEMRGAMRDESIGIKSVLNELIALILHLGQFVGAPKFPLWRPRLGWDWDTRGKPNDPKEKVYDIY